MRATEHLMMLNLHRVHISLYCSFVKLTLIRLLFTQAIKPTLNIILLRNREQYLTLVLLPFIYTVPNHKQLVPPPHAQHPGYEPEHICCL